MNTPNEIQAELERAALLLQQGQPKTAEQALRKLLNTDPNNRKAQRTLGLSLQQQDRHDEAIVIFERLFEESDKEPVSVLDLAKSLQQRGTLRRAADILQEVLKKIPTLTPGWYLLGDVLVEHREFGPAREAFTQAVANDPFRVQIDQCKRSLQENDVAKAERIFRHILEQDPLHVEALAGMEVLAMEAEQWMEAERLFTQIKKRTRYWPTLLMGLSQLFLMTNRVQYAKETLSTLVEIHPRLFMAWNMLGTANELLMQNDDAIAAFEHSLKLEPNQPRAYVSIGNIQRVIGKREASVATLEKALRFEGMNGEVYWGLSNLKDYEFSDKLVADMRTSLDRDASSLHNAAPMYFALAKAYENRNDYAAAFAYYCKGNAIQKAFSHFDCKLYGEEIERIRTVFDEDLFARFKNIETSKEQPIFIVGMPRTGSTLVEQILATHSQVDATMELPFVEQYVREFQSRADDIGVYPESIVGIDKQDIASLAMHYLKSASIYRHGAPRFLDKMPNNFVHIGLIHLMFSNALFIDIVRNPLDTCLSVFKQRFASGQPFSYSLKDLACYYRGYRRLMGHWEQVLATRVYRVDYENLVTNPDTEIRRLLEFCDLDFEAACLAPERTDRAIRTPSSEQVRQPISMQRIDYWKNFEGHLRPLQRMLAEGKHAANRSESD